MYATMLSILLIVEPNSPQSYFYGFLGATIALVFCVLGSAYGTARSGAGVTRIGVEKPELMMKHTLPVIMAGMIGIYGLIIAVFVTTNISTESYTDFQAWTHLGAGLAVGLSGLSAGTCIGVIGDVGVRASIAQRPLFVSMVLMLVFSEALGLYGLIIALILAVKKS